MRIGSPQNTDPVTCEKMSLRAKARHQQLWLSRVLYLEAWLRLLARGQSTTSCLPSTTWKTSSPACLSRGKHSHKRSNLPNSLFSLGQPWQVSRTMTKTEKKGKGLQRVTYQLRYQFYKKLMEVISMEMSRFLGHSPPLAALYTQRGIFLRISQPTCLGSCHAGRTCGGKFLSPGGLDISRSPTLRPPRVLPTLLRAIRPCYTRHRIYQVAHMLFPVWHGCLICVILSAVMGKKG